MENLSLPHMSLLAHFRVVLCNPDSSFNIGAVCRSMKTMGFTDLAIAGRILDYDPEHIRFMAVHAYDVFEGATHYATLKEALADTALSAGVTRRQGKSRKRSSFLPEEFAARTLPEGTGTVALVFGNEEHGLTTEELASCTASIHIPSSPEFPSLNLSHAVQVVTYTFFRAAALYRYATEASPSYEDGIFHHERPVDSVRIDSLMSGVMETLTELGFFRISDAEPTRIFLRDIMGRALMNAREAEEMANIFRKIRHIRR